MAAATHALTPPPVQRPRVLMVGTAFATAGTLMVLATLLGIYLTQRSAIVSVGERWVPEGSTIPLQQPTVLLFTLLASAVTVQWAVYSVARNDRVNAYLALGLTTVLGIAFINMMSYLYSLMALDITASSQAVLLYAISGAHLAMLIGGMVFIAVTAFRALAGQETGRQHDGVSAAALYWYAMVLAYGVIWYAVYVTK